MSENKSGVLFLRDFPGDVIRGVVFRCLPEKYRSAKQGIVMAALLYRFLGESVFGDGYEYRDQAVALSREFDFSSLPDLPSVDVLERLDRIEKLLKRIDANTSGVGESVASVELLTAFGLLDSHAVLGNVDMDVPEKVVFDDRRVRVLRDSARRDAKRISDRVREARFSAGVVPGDVGLDVEVEL